jgi:ribosome biogenesis GTPase A
MDFRADKVDGSVARLDALIMALLPAVSGPALQTVERWRSDAAALHFHLRRRPGATPLVTVILGGTGTGKSTIVNRILGQNISATSFRRTYTSGPVAIAASAAQVPPEWLGVEHIEMAPADLPARGRTGSLLIAILGKDLTCQLTLVDTPDLDGDQPTHHA